MESAGEGGTGGDLMNHCRTLLIRNQFASKSFTDPNSKKNWRRNPRTESRRVQNSASRARLPVPRIDGGLSSSCAEKR